MTKNKLPKDYDPSGWQWQDRHGQILQIEDLTRDDLLQVACACMDALENAEAACLEQQAIFSAWRNGRKHDA